MNNSPDPMPKNSKSSSNVSESLKKLNNSANRKILKKVLLITLLLLVFLLGLWWYFARAYQETDNAYVMADSATVSSRIPGKVVKINVNNDDFVKVGETLVELDSEDYNLKVQQIEANLEALREEFKLRETNLKLIETTMSANVDSAKAVLNIALDKEKQAQRKIQEIEDKRTSADADLKHYEKDFKRFEVLYGQKAVAEREFDRTKTAYKKAKAQVDAIGEELASARIAYNSARKDTERARAQLKVAEAEELQVQMERYKINNLQAQIKKVEAELELARLQMSYCKIPAPINGYVAQKRFQVGDWVQPGQPLLAIVPLDEVYVEANFKENQIEEMRIGQRAEIVADVYRGHKYYGRIGGIRAGTGAAFSLLPPENATGNWIKVVQRVPVRIQLDNPPPPDYPLRLGFSLKVRVDISNKKGPKLKSSSY